MSWKRKRFQNFKLYAVTDLKAADADALARIEAAMRGGADIVQLRAKSVPDGPMVRLALRARAAARRYRVLLAVNDRADLALAVGADILHVGQDDLPVTVLRRFLGRRVWLGKSTHSSEEMMRTAREDVDYISVGPVFRTPTKPDYSPVGLALVAEASRRVRKPFVAIGGIDAATVDEVLAAGARRVAVVRAIFQAGDVEAAARAFAERLAKAWRVSVRRPRSSTALLGALR